MRLRELIMVSAVASMLGACLQLPDFESGSIVKGPRVLAVVAEPPEIAPGEALDLSILVAGVEDRQGMRISWRACGSFDGFFGGGGAQYGEEQADEGCGGGLAFELGEGQTAQLPALLTADLFDNLDVIAMTLGSDLPEGIVEQIRSSVGIAFLVEATVRADGKLIRATKRVLISESPTPHSNPPPPSFKLGDQVIGSDADPMRCVRADATPAIVAPDADIELAPSAELPEESWLEMYNVINARGELLERKETAFYSWYTTAGELDSGTTKSPLRNNIWHTPVEPGDYPLWVIVRDGHGGTSACELTVQVQ
jgi:hypothetical protein